MKEFMLLLSEFGLPVAGAVVMGLFIYIILRYILDSVVSQTKTLKSKFESFSKLMEDIQHHNNIAEIDVGITLSLCRFCLSTKWMHWLRVIPARLWKYEATTESGEIILLDMRDLVDNKI